MRVAIDFKITSTDGALRGMGRYTQQQVREALRVDPSLEVLLLIETGLDATLLDWQAHPRVHPIRLLYDGTPWALDRYPSFADVLGYSRRLDATLRHLGADLYHSTTLFVPPHYASVTACPVVATFYDCIPLVFPTDYFPSREARIGYLQCLQAVSRAERVIAISQSTRDDLRRYAGCPGDRIDIAYPLVEEIFRPAAAPDGLLADAAALTASIGWVPPGRFILSVTGIHRSKNLATLLRAYAEARRRGLDLPLVLVLPNVWATQHCAALFGRPDGVVVLANLPEADLAWMYRLADFVVQVSLYEGFGYPVAEAMASGAAVIALDATSIPEIAGDAVLLVPPAEPEPVAEAMLRLAADAPLRQALRRAAPARVARFRDLDALGQATVAAYRAALGTAAARPPRPRISLWSSMPPLDCGVADYTGELADALAPTHDVEVRVDGSYAPTPRGPLAVTFHDGREAAALHNGREAAALHDGREAAMPPRRTRQCSRSAAATTRRSCTGRLAGRTARLWRRSPCTTSPWASASTTWRGRGGRWNGSRTPCCGPRAATRRWPSTPPPRRLATPCRTGRCWSGCSIGIRCWDGRWTVAALPWCTRRS